MIFTHGFGEQIGLCGQTADIEVHDALWELFVLQSSWAVAVILVEQRPDLIVLEDASELVQSFLELFELNFAVVIEVEISQGLFGSLPFVGLSIWLFSDFFVNDFFELFESLWRNVVLRLDKIPGANQDVLQVLKLKLSLLFIFPVGYKNWVRHNNRQRLILRWHLLWIFGPFHAWRFRESLMVTRFWWWLWGVCWLQIRYWGGPKWHRVDLGIEWVFQRPG